MTTTLTTLLLAITFPSHQQLQQPPDPQRAAVTAVNHLGLGVLRALAERARDDNQFLSPHSITTALSMVLAGARDETRAEMLTAMGLPSDTPDEVLHRGLAELRTRFAGGGGAGDERQRARVAELRAQLAAANAKAERLQNQRDWQAVREAADAAQEIARQLNRLLPTLDRYEWTDANAVWTDLTFPLLPDFVATVDRWYGTGSAQSLDFVHDAAGAIRRINGWAAQHTNGRIDQLIPPGGLPPATGLVVTNATWFRGEWADPFDTDRTAEQPFHLADGRQVTTALMRDSWRSNARYGAFAADGAWFATPREVPGDPGTGMPQTYPGDDGGQLLELPYKGGELTMVVLLPRTRTGLPRLMELLTTERFEGWLTKAERREVDAALPRFELRERYELSRELVGCGMGRAFSPPGTKGGAQFGGITAAADPQQQVYIGAVHHQSFVQVGEQGTEAAAATAVALAVGAEAPSRVMVPFRPVFRADRPFAFLIRDTRSGAILFAGCHVDPAK